MNKLIPLLAFSILILVPAGAYDAQAGIVLYRIDAGHPNGAGGDCAGNGSGGLGPIPGAIWDNVLSTCILASDFTLPFGTQMHVEDGTILQNDANFVIDTLSLLNNRDTVKNKGLIVNNGLYRNLDDGVLNNFPTGTFTNNGNVIDNENTVNNCGTFTNDGTTDIENFNNYIDGIVTGIDPGEFNQLNLVCPFGELLVIGGEIIPIESNALILAGAQSFSWMIPVLLSGIGIGLILVRRKCES